MNILKAASILTVGFLLGAFTIHSRTAAAQANANVRGPLPSPLIEKFDLWGSLSPASKLTFYSGWANGLFTATRDPGTLAVGRCLEKLTFDQIVAMIDKWSAEHRERFRNPIGIEIMDAVTATGSPCGGIDFNLERKNVLCATDNQGRVSCFLASK